MKDIIKQHNLKLLSEEDNVDINVQNSNCSDNNKIGDFNMNGVSNSKHNFRTMCCYRYKNKCSLNGNCKISYIICMSKVKSSVRCYISSKRQTFKNGFYSYDIH